MKSKRLKTIALAASALCFASHVMAQDAPTEANDSTSAKAIAKKAGDALGLEFEGYGRGGFYSASGNAPKGGYALGGDLQKYRLGNEGDNYVEFGIRKKFDLGEGLKWGVFYMPKIYNGDTGTAQIYSYMTGLAFAPEMSFWAGQRFHRIEDVHIVDNWVMEDGYNYGDVVDGILLGSAAKLNVGIYTDGNSDNKNNKISATNPTNNNGKRANFQIVDIPTNPGGKLNLTGGVIGGTYALGKKGAALGLLHNQKNFIAPGFNNSFFVQASTGHADIRGKFYNLDQAGVAQAGAKQLRVIEAISWQSGKLGGQALMGYQTATPDSGPLDGVKTTDLSLGGRMSYGIAKQVKLLGEVGLTSRKIEDQEKQRLYKATAAVAFSPNTDFWTRPEFRVYLTRANWNDAASAANATSFGANGRTKATAFGVQMEVWW
ncbi:MAG: maltoporin [Rhodoferax sp.]|nr:maltoporin [Rhodoferax sp.]